MKSYPSCSLIFGVLLLLFRINAEFSIGRAQESNDVPVVISHPAGRSVLAGETVTFTVGATGAEPLQFQWQKNGTDLPGETSPAFTLTNVQQVNSGGYSVVVRNNAGVASSFSGYLAVQPSAQLFAIGTNAPADISIGTWVMAPEPQRFGANLREPSELNNYTGDSGFEPIVIKRQHTATGGGANYIDNRSGPTTSHYQTMADGFFDGAHVRVYRPSTNGGALQFVRAGVVTNYVTDGFRRLNFIPVTASQFTDTQVTPGVPYQYQVRAVNTSARVSTNFNPNLFVMAIPEPGSTGSTNAVWTNSFYRQFANAPAVPANVTATPLPGAVLIGWDNNSETDLAGYYVYRRSVSTNELFRIYLDSDGPTVQAGDIYFLEMEVDNAPVHRMHDRLHSSSLNDAWRVYGGANWPYGLNVTTERDSSTFAPENGGRSSLRIQTTGTHEVSIRQPRFSAPEFYGGYYPALVPGRMYRVDVWLRQSGVPSGTVRFQMTQHYSSVQRTWNVGTNWAKYTHTFTAPMPSTNGSIAEVMIAFNGPGTLWVDNLVLYEDADGDPATDPVFTLRPNSAQSLLDFRPSVLRIWTGVDTEYWGNTLDDWTRSEWESTMHWHPDHGRTLPDDPYKLPTGLEFCRNTGADPWLIVGSYMLEKEWRDLIEYLAAPYDPVVDTPASKPYAYRRYSQGQQAPWTDMFPRLYLEYGNELWNPGFQWYFGNGNLTGQFSEHFFNAAKSSPWFPAVSNKIDFMVNGWIVSAGTNGYGHAASMAAPSSRYNDIAVYIGGWEVGNAVGGAVVNDSGFQDYMLYAPSFIRFFMDQHAASREANRLAGYEYELAIYEGGPGYGLPSPGQEFEPVSETYGKSLAAAVATLDTYLYNSYLRIDPQAYFSYGPGYNWSSHSTIDRGRNPHANWLALQMRNQFASGAMVATAIHRSPTVNIPVHTNGAGNAIVPAYPNTPLIQPYAFRDGDRYAVFVLSRCLSNATPTTLRLPFTSVTNATLHKLTGNPRLGNSTNLLIVPTQEAITNFAQDLSFTMPPGSVYLFVFEGTNTPEETNPTGTISQSLGQNDPTTLPVANFTIAFSQPVTGFSSNDVQVTGTSGARRVIVSERAPFNGMFYNVAVSGMTGPGSVMIDISAGAAIGSNGLASLAATIIDNAVQYELRAPQNLLLAWDDFNVPVTTGLTPLNGVNSGVGWSSAWQVQNYNAETYTNGYAIHNTARLAFGSLLTSGNYAVGGRGYEMSARTLNVDGAFENFKIFDSTPPSIGLDGTTLWMSVLLRKESADLAPVYLAMVNASGLTAYGQIDIGAGYFGDASTVGGTRYWSLAVRNLSNGVNVVRSDVPIVIGETALLVVRMQFGASDTASLFVNPVSLAEVPSAPSATVTVNESNLAFHSVRFYAGLGAGLWSGDGLNKGSMDELRFGDSYASVTPRPLEGIAAWRQLHFGSPANVGAAADDSDSDGDGIVNFVEYALGGNPRLGDTSILPYATIETNRFGMIFTLNPTADDVVWTVEASASLVSPNWIPIVSRVGTDAWSTAPGVDLSYRADAVVVVFTSGETSNAAQQFMRLRISKR